VLNVVMLSVVEPFLALPSNTNLRQKNRKHSSLFHKVENSTKKVL
jgi:hypothetical protein